MDDKRGGYRVDKLYEVHPEIETAAQEFTNSETAKKNCSFSVSKVSKFINKKWEEPTGFELEKGQDMRSHSAIR